MAEIELYFDQLDDSGKPCSNGLGSDKAVSFGGKTVNELVWNQPAVENDLKVFGINVNSKPISRFEATDGVRKWYVIEPFFISKSFLSPGVFDNLSESSLQLLRSGQLELVIWYTKEAHNLDMCNWLAKLHRQIEKQDIKKATLFFSDLNLKQNYKHWLNHPLNPKSRLKLVPLNYWFDIHKSQIGNYRASNYKGYCLEPEDINLDQLRHKHFLCLNAVAKNHRLFLLSELHRRGLMQKGLCSLLFRYGEHKAISGLETTLSMYYFHKHPQYDQQMKSLYNFAKTYGPHNPLTLDYQIDDVDKDDRRHDPKTFLQSYFSIVSESVVEDNVLFITEKCLKPFHYFHPFIVFGGQGTLQVLRKKGFYSFPEFFDETYDEIPCLAERMELILAEIEKLCVKTPEELNRMYREIWPKLEHNWRHFFDQKAETDCRKRILDDSYYI